MTTLTRWNPFKSLARIDPALDFEDMVRGFGMRPLLRDLQIAPEIRLDVKEDDKSFQVKAEIPGVNKNDIEVSVNGNQVSISAEVRHESEKKEGQWDLCTERYYGRMFRAFTLPSDVDDGKTEAHYENGVLSLTLPKKANGQSRRIAVH